jgi:hypothetical protein
MTPAFLVQILSSPGAVRKSGSEPKPVKRNFKEQAK